MDPNPLWDNWRFSFYTLTVPKRSSHSLVYLSKVYPIDDEILKGSCQTNWMKRSEWTTRSQPQSQKGSSLRKRSPSLDRGRGSGLERCDCKWLLSIVDGLAWARSFSYSLGLKVGAQFPTFSIVALEIMLSETCDIFLGKFILL